MLAKQQTEREARATSELAAENETRAAWGTREAKRTPDLAVMGQMYNSTVSRPSPARAPRSETAKKPAVLSQKKAAATKSAPARQHQKPMEEPKKKKVDEFIEACAKVRQPGECNDADEIIQWRTSAAEFWERLRRETRHHPLCGKIRSLIPDRADLLVEQSLDDLLAEV